MLILLFLGLWPSRPNITLCSTWTNNWQFWWLLHHASRCPLGLCLFLEPDHNLIKAPVIVIIAHDNSTSWPATSGHLRTIVFSSTLDFSHRLWLTTVSCLFVFLEKFFFNSMDLFSKFYENFYKSTSSIFAQRDGSFVLKTTRCAFKLSLTSHPLDELAF